MSIEKRKTLIESMKILIMNYQKRLDNWCEELNRLDKDSDYYQSDKDILDVQIVLLVSVRDELEASVLYEEDRLNQEGGE